jgi:symplekin
MYPRDPSNPSAPRLQQQAERLARSRAEILDEAGRKRGPPEQAAGAYADAKRQKLEAASLGNRRQEIKPLGPGPHSLASVFTLADNPDLASFNVTQIPAAYAVRISIATLMNVEKNVLEHALNVSFPSFLLLFTHFDL